MDYMLEQNSKQAQTLGRKIDLTASCFLTRSVFGSDHGGRNHLALGNVASVLYQQSNWHFHMLHLYFPISGQLLMFCRLRKPSSP